ncbi:MAG: hypothetical protein JWM59_755 [Verrucomicrobiales bacterium]|nr:hypothetical protein [Verrucomicrobiales bacterium]
MFGIGCRSSPFGAGVCSAYTLGLSRLDAFQFSSFWPPLFRSRPPMLHSGLLKGSGLPLKKAGPAEESLRLHKIPGLPQTASHAVQEHHPLLKAVDHLPDHFPGALHDRREQGTGGAGVPGVAPEAHRKRTFRISRALNKRKISSRLSYTSGSPGGQGMTFRQSTASPRMPSPFQGMAGGFVLQPLKKGPVREIPHRSMNRIRGGTVFPESGCHQFAADTVKSQKRNTKESHRGSAVWNRCHRCGIGREAENSRGPRIPVRVSSHTD